MGCYEPAALALTTVFVRTAQPEGEILEADVEVNAVGFRWGAIADGLDPAGGEDVHDLENTIADELGHVSGSPTPAGRQENPATPTTSGTQSHCAAPHRPTYWRRHCFHRVPRATPFAAR